MLPHLLQPNTKEKVQIKNWFFNTRKRNSVHKEQVFKRGIRQKKKKKTNWAKIPKRKTLFVCF